MAEQMHTVLQDQYDNLVLARHDLKGGWKLEQIKLARRYRNRAMRLKGQTVTFTQLARSDSMWKQKGKTTVLARLRLVKKAKPGRPDQDNVSITSDVPLLRVSTVDSKITATSDGGSIAIVDQTSRTYVTHLDSAWLSHAPHSHDAQSDSDESDHISIEFESDTSSDSVSEASDGNASEDSDQDQDDTDGDSSETSSASAANA
ncbi:hypothetical protein C8Q72DRAFT_853793 [Fomitopsis betulina]|nr:hypothetical protein C8Q72DRAFT_853793 [Fomitopsis betulina]